MMPRDVASKDYPGGLGRDFSVSKATHKRPAPGIISIRPVQYKMTFARQVPDRRRAVPIRPINVADYPAFVMIGSRSTSTAGGSPLAEYEAAFIGCLGKFPMVQSGTVVCRSFC